MPSSTPAFKHTNWLLLVVTIHFDCGFLNYSGHQLWKLQVALGNTQDLQMRYSDI